MNEDKVIHPLGWLAGREGNLADVLEYLALEMLGHKADLEEQARRTKDEQARAAMLETADKMQKYGVALNVVWLQMKPEVARKSPAALASIRELANKHKITLPEWMKGQQPET